ncbi:MAG: hypothetical protein M1826_003250 [Phylliscum demangeonii]|nr:MAG: hypothetical protein M1826_003250 [Phylliscum demangeonii]
MAALRAMLAFYPRQSTISRLEFVERHLLRLTSSVGVTLSINLDAAESGWDQVEHFECFPDPGAEYIWLDYTDPECLPDDVTVDTSELRVTMKWPHAFANAYDTCPGMQNGAFATMEENISWDLDGFLLALALRNNSRRTLE